MALDNHGHALATVVADGKLELWDLRRPDDAPLLLSGDKYDHPAFSPDGRTLAAVTLDGELAVWDVRNPTAPPAIFQEQPDSTTK